MQQYLGLGEEYKFGQHMHTYFNFLSFLHFLYSTSRPIG